MNINYPKEFKTFSKWLAATFFVISLGLVLLMNLNEFSFRQSILFLPTTLQKLFSNWIVWLIFFMPYLHFIHIRFLVKTFKNKGRNIFFKRVLLTVLLPVALIFSAFKFSSWYTQNSESIFIKDDSVENAKDTVLQLFSNDRKFRGVHFFSPRQPQEIHFQPLVKNNIEWIVQVPFIWQNDYDSPELNMTALGQDGWSRKDTSISKIDSLANTFGIQSILKPHIWMDAPSDGKWRSDIDQTTEEDWNTWSENYSKITLHYARLAQSLQIPLFCIGTELKTIAKKHPDYWIELIKEIRKIYAGKLTYAANWHEEFEEISFWNDLDYIGIQAYFPLSENKNPTVKELEKGWKSHFEKIQKIQKRFQKPILFTEIGYKSSADAAIEPWVWPSFFSSFRKKVSTQTQENCYQAFFNTFWKEDWFAGALIWQWRANHEKAGGMEKINFTPQNKPAENMLAKWFGKAIK